MNLTDWLAELERRDLQAEAVAATAPLANTYRAIAAELTRVNGSVVPGKNGQENGPPRLLKAADVAERLGCSVRYVYAKAPTFPFTVHIGGLVRFSEPGLEQWIRGRAA